MILQHEWEQKGESRAVGSSYGFQDTVLRQVTGVSMSKTRKKYQEKEERRHPDSPDGLVVAASKNRAFAERFVGMARLALIQAGVKHGRR